MDGLHFCLLIIIFFYNYLLGSYIMERNNECEEEMINSLKTHYMLEKDKLLSEEREQMLELKSVIEELYEAYLHRQNTTTKGEIYYVRYADHLRRAEETELIYVALFCQSLLLIGVVIALFRSMRGARILREQIQAMEQQANR